MDLISRVSNFLSLDRETIRRIANKAPTFYRTYTKPKKNGSGYRIIYHPAKQTKMLQYALLYTLLKDFEVSQNAMAYLSKNESNFNGSPIKRNAYLHKNFAYSIHLDFSNFFPSIKPLDLISIIEKKFPLEKIAKDFIRNCLFIRKKGYYELSIGAPTSPIIVSAKLIQGCFN